MEKKTENHKWNQQKKLERSNNEKPPNLVRTEEENQKDCQYA